jgi:hypothetical protein
MSQKSSYDDKYLRYKMKYIELKNVFDNMNKQEQLEYLEKKYKRNFVRPTGQTKLFIPIIPKPFISVIPKPFIPIVPKPVVPKNGLMINNKLVSSISGPISMCYLKPKMVKQTGIDFPLIILFGDQHFGVDKMCRNCTCVNNNCCYKIHDENFLQNIDKLSSDKYPVDFYIEHFNKYTGGFENGIMEKLLSGNMSICYERLLRNSPIYKKCPTKSIRWHYGDARSHKLKTEGIIDSIHFLNNPYHKNNELRQQVKSQLTSSGWLHLIKNAVKILLFIKPPINGRHNFNFKPFAFKLFKILYDQKKKSLIYKQFIKQTYPPFKNWNYWVNMYLQALISNRNFDLLPLYTVDEIDNIENNFNPKIADLFLEICVSFLDIYTIMRMMKQPSGINSAQPSLSFGYFGEFHSQNIIKLLVNNELYDIVYNKEESKHVNRCIKIDQYINLDEDVKKHNIARG